MCCRHGKEAGQQNLYQNNIQFRTFCGRLIALAYLPPLEVPWAFIEIIALFGHNAPCLIMLNYFCEYYIHGKVNPLTGVHHQPDYPVRYWNMFQAMQDETERTNNHCEGNNNRLNRLEGDVQPGMMNFAAFMQVMFSVGMSIWTKFLIKNFLNFFQAELYWNETKQNSFLGGRYVGDTKCQRYARLLHQIAAKVNSYLNRVVDRVACVRSISGMMLLAKIEKKCNH